MGTRADFYVGRGKSAEWLGSIAWDGYPDGIPESVKGAESEASYRDAVRAMLDGREDATVPAMGWPWPWDDSGTTDYTYAFDGGTVHASCFGSPWWAAVEEAPEDVEGLPADHPDMSARKATTLGKRSGLMVFST